MGATCIIRRILRVLLGASQWRFGFLTYGASVRRLIRRAPQAPPKYSLYPVIYAPVIYQGDI